MKYKSVKSRKEIISDIEEKFRMRGGLSYNNTHNLSLVSKEKEHRKSCRCELCKFREEDGLKSIA